MRALTRLWHLYGFPFQTRPPRPGLLNHLLLNYQGSSERACVIIQIFT